jgi:hypothetical protein
MEKTFQAAQLTHERFLTIDHSFKIFFDICQTELSQTSGVTYSTTHQRLAKVQFGRYKKLFAEVTYGQKSLMCCAA